MKKKITVLTSLVLTFVLAIVGVFSINYSNSGNNQLVRSVELNNSSLEDDSYFNAFDSYELELNDGKADFVGYNSMKFSDFYELDLLSYETVDNDVLTKYSTTYDYDEGIVSLSVSLVTDEETSIIDTIYGVVLMDDNENFDVAFDCDGEILLLSELEEAGMLDNCGFWSKLKKVWNTNAGKIGTIATVAACAVVGVVCAVVPGGQLVTAICIGAAVGAIGGAVTAGVATYIEEGVVDWDAVLCYAGAGAIVGGVTAAASYKITSAIKQLFPKSNPSSTVKGFDSYSGFKNEYGKASDYVQNGEWHHIVEQQTYKNGLNSAPQIYNSQNTVAIPKELHTKISAYYSSMNPELGMTNRAYINTLTYSEQYAKGMEILYMFAEKMGITPFFL